MEKKATLLIKNLRGIYTMDEMQPYVKNHAFIAVHHDEILDFGIHAFAHHVDKDTRILDCANHIAIPAFIEVDAWIPSNMNSMREYDEFFMRYMYNGTLSVQLSQKIPDVLRHNYHYTILQQKHSCKEEEILYAIAQMKREVPSKNPPFCISCKDQTISLQNQMLAAQMLAMKEQIDAYELLKALTCNPANYLGLERLGYIKKGGLANILILSAKDLHTFFYSLDQNQIAQIIHKGVRIYPNLLI